MNKTGIWKIKNELDDSKIMDTENDLNQRGIVAKLNIKE